MIKTLIYDGTFEGFLSAVFYVYEHKLDAVQIRKDTPQSGNLWGDTLSIETNLEKSARVWEGFKKKVSAASARSFYANHLSEIVGEEDNMLMYMRYVFSSEKDVSSDFSTPSVLRVSKVSKMVGREKHRMEAFVRFQLMDNEVWYATIEPDFNVLPLISKHFKNRYADQKWLIADFKRGYGLYYDLQEVHIVSEQYFHNFTQFNEAENAYQNLWKTYFKSINITERRNIKLHLQNVPLRYWKYLCEKKP
jgi:probable DNA metabolism protein